MPVPRYLLIANPGTKRCESYRRELQAFWSGRGVRAEVEVVPWADVVPRDGNLDDLPAFDAPAVVRIESPGKNTDVMRLLLAAGVRDDPAEPPRDWQAVAMPKGLLLRPGLWFCGFCRVLRGLQLAFDKRSHLALNASPKAIAAMFDKTVSAIALRAAGVPTPDWLDDPRDALTGRWRSTYLKLNSGSSAMGMIHLASWGGRHEGLATFSENDGQYFNSRQLASLAGDALQRAVDFLLCEGAFAQQGIWKGSIDGERFDVRVVCVYGEPVATIFRLSRHPMTNLHLGGRRGDFTRCRAAIPTRHWLDGLDHCVAAARCFNSAVVGVDLLFEPGLRQQHVLEVNAFGDFFPGFLNERGRSIHDCEIEATAARQDWK